MIPRDSRSAGWVRASILTAIIVAFSVIPAAAQKQAESKNMELVGYNDLQGRSAYMPTIHKQGGAGSPTSVTTAGSY